MLSVDLGHRLPSLIHLGPSDPRTAARALDAPGGFSWWYVDMRTEDNSGFVVIWSFGLPFLPEIPSAARARSARQRPSLNVVFFEQGRESFYLLQAHDEPDASWDIAGQKWRFGRTTIQLSQRDSTERLEIDLDLDVPGLGNPVRGRIEIEGPGVENIGDIESVDATHLWRPIMGPAHGEATLALPGRSIHLRGAAYHDQNMGLVSLDQLGIARWIWGRAVTAHHLYIYYLLWPKDGSASPVAVILESDHTGQTTIVTDLRVELSPPRTARFGMRYEDRITLHRGSEPYWTMRLTRLIEDGPFYLRGLIDMDIDGKTTAALGEWVDPNRIDLRRHRPLVGMRVHRTSGPNSFWLPLFCGPREGRLARLFSRRGA